MGLYFRVFYFQVLRYFTYPLEMVAIVIRRILEVGFLVLFWLAVSHSSNGTINTREIISYILIARSITGITSGTGLMFGGTINEMVKKGGINNYLIKPVSLIPYLYAIFSGQRAVTALVALITFLIGIVLSPVSLTLANVALFIAYFVIAVLIITVFSVLVGIFSFYITEAAPLRWSISHVFSVFSGSLAPISFFSPAWQKFLLYSPFPAAIYGPASVFAPGTIIASHTQMLLVGVVWLIVLSIITNFLWKRALRSYDAIGI